jgi:hypothetical protein
VSSVALDWELPHWNPQLQADVTPPRVVDMNDDGASSVTVNVSDRTPDYFSGVHDIAVIEGSGWESTAMNVPVNADLDASASFAVRDNVDPSGPLMLRLVDRDGNETTTKVHDGFCQRSAYPDVDTLRLAVNVTTPNGQTSGMIDIDANPCGDEATVRFIEIDQAGGAAPYLKSALLTSGSTPTTIQPHESVGIEVKTKANLAGQFTAYTNLNVVLNDHTYQIPIELRVDKTTGVNEDAGNEGGPAITVLPQPVHDRLSLALETSISTGTVFEIFDGRGALTARIDGRPFAGDTRLELPFGEGSMPDLSGGVYLIRRIDGSTVAQTSFVVAR